jgi:hypothetical protein
MADDLIDYLSGVSFRSNPNLRPEGTRIEYTEEMIQELIKCKKDPCYFISTYINVVHPDKGIVKMELYDYQHKMVNTYHNNRRVIFLTARQQGKTSVSAAYFVWFVLFNDNKSVAVLANKQNTADEIMARIRMAYENLPKWLQQGVKSWNKRSIELENGSKVFGSATSSSGIRGKSISLLYIDEFAFVENNLAEEFFTAVYPTITAGKDTKIFMTSTPNGFNHFYKFWNEAEKGINGFVPLRIHWHETPGRDQKWYEEQRGVLGEMKAAQEIDAEFLGSSKQLLTAATMACLSADVPIKEFNDHRKGLKIYKPPVKDHKYTMTVDVSRGRHMDASAFMVFDVTEYPHRIVASFNNNETAPMMYSNIVYQVAKEYNSAYVLIEINDVGAQVADELYYTFEYEEMYWTKSGDVLGKSGADPYPGVRTTKKTKRIGCSNLKDIVERQQLIVNDLKAIQELSTFVQNDAGTWEADEGFHDDAVACLWLFGWLVAQPWFKDLYDRDIRNKMYSNAMKQIEEELTPFGFIQNGQDDIYEDDGVRI